MAYPKHISIKLSGICDQKDFVDLKSTNPFTDIKKDLNDAKTAMNAIFNDPNINYAHYKYALDMYYNLKRRFGIDYQCQQVSNAGLKLHELLSHYKIFQPRDELKVFLNAEFPGSFITLLNHHAVMKNTKLDWYASSLVSGGDKDLNALEDRYGLWSTNPHRWLMQVDNEHMRKFPYGPVRFSNNGDTTNIDNILDFEQYFIKHGKVDLYTHDAGMDVSSDFSTQESQNAKLHFGCALAGLLTLKEGGSFIAKQYTFFNPTTYSLLYLYQMAFDEFYICKPVTSRPVNSETYLVGKGFRGLTAEMRETLISKMTTVGWEDPDAEAVVEQIPAKFIEELKRTARLIYKQQIASLLKYKEIIEKTSLNEIKEQRREDRKKLEDDFITRYPITRVSKSQWLKTLL